MHDELRKEAKKAVDAQMAFYTCSIVFSFTTLVLIILSFAIPAITFWLMLPIPVFLMVLAVLYLSAFGLPTSISKSSNWKEEAIQKEMRKRYLSRKQALTAIQELSAEEKLQLKELEALEATQGWEDDLV